MTHEEKFWNGLRRYYGAQDRVHMGERELERLRKQSRILTAVLLPLMIIAGGGIVALVTALSVPIQ